RPSGDAASQEGNGVESAAAAAAESAAVAGGDAEPTRTPGRSQSEALALIRAALERLSESRAGKPIYVRHLAQGIRAIDPEFDEQNYGFRTLTELMYLGQREGVLRMQRDRQGAWRISPAAAPSQADQARAPAADLNGEDLAREDADAALPVATPGESGDEIV